MGGTQLLWSSFFRQAWLIFCLCRRISKDDDEVLSGMDANDEPLVQGYHKASNKAKLSMRSKAFRVSR